MSSSIPFKEQTEIGQTFYNNTQRQQTSASKMGWASEASQKSRFNQLIQIAKFFDNTALDIGCGCADLFHFMKAQELDIQYHGIDINESFLEIGRTSLSNETDATIEKIDFFDPTFKDEFDYIFASGVFNHRVPNQYDYLEGAIKKMIQLSRYAVSFNILSASTPKHMQQPHAFFYYSASKVMDICLKYTPFVVVKQHYLPNDMTIYLYKEAVERFDSTTIKVSIDTQTHDTPPDRFDSLMTK